MAKIVTIGEIMMRLSTIDHQLIKQSNQFNINYGGAEANVAIALGNFNHDVYHVSKLPNNALGQSIISYLKSNNVKCDYINFSNERLGTYYLEKGSSIKGAKVIYDRKDSAFALVNDIEWDLKNLFEDCDLLHVSGIILALSQAWQDILLKIIRQAKSYGVKVCFDTNYRPNMWTYDEARPILKEIYKHIDYVSAGKMDAIHLLELSNNDQLEVNDYFKLIKDAYPNIEVIYATTRKVLSNEDNMLQAHLYYNGAYFDTDVISINNITDRVGGGDAYSAGIIHGLLSNDQPQDIVDFALVCTSLKHTINGDALLMNLDELSQLKNNLSGAINR